MYGDKNWYRCQSTLFHLYILCVTTYTYIIFQAPLNIGTYVHPQSLMHLNAL